MKTHWFSVFSVAGMVLLAGSVVGNELRWGKPADNAPVAPSVIHIPAKTAVSKSPESPKIVQVQQIEPTIPSRIAVPPAVQSADDYFETFETRPRPLPSSTTWLPNESPTVAPVATACGGQIGLKSIRDISHDIRPAQTGPLPEECQIERPSYYGRDFSQTNFMWRASALSTQAAYFEDVQLERHGNTIVHPVLQPIVSGAKFFATIPLLPYKMGVTPPCECVYTLGHRRAGSCAPYMVEPFPISPRGALFQAGAVAGGVFAIP